MNRNPARSFAALAFFAFSVARIAHAQEADAGSPPTPTAVPTAEAPPSPVAKPGETRLVVVPRETSSELVRLPPSVMVAPLVPVGRAAPPTEAATRGTGTVRPGIELFAQYALRNTVGLDGNGKYFHVFDVPRVHAAVEGEWQGAKGRVVLEATRSASEGSLVGVAGDSLVLRVREAYAAYRPFRLLEISGGVVPTLTVPNLDGTWMLRPIAPSVLEANGFLSPADLGARVRTDLPDGYGFLAIGAYNGEGYTSRELNRGKNVEGAVEIHPLPHGKLAPLGVFASFTSGSTGTALARSNRFVTGLVWQGAMVRAGAFFAHAWGLADLGTARALALTAFVRVEPIDRLYLGARFDHVVRDAVNDPLNTLDTVWGTVGYRVLDPLEGFLAVTRSIPTRRAEDEAPGSNYWDLRIIGRVVF
jgi:hypothetical protein